MKKELFSSLVGLTLVAGLGTGANAQDISTQSVNSSVNDDGEVTVVAESYLTEGTPGTMEASASKKAKTVGKGSVTGKDPVFGKPYAYASTTSSVGTVKTIKARIDCNNDGEGTSTSGWKTLNNTTKAKSSKLTSSTEKAKFTGYHEIKKSSTSSVQKTQSHISF